MKYNHIYKADVVNGPGIRVSLFTQGCEIHCPGCFNSELWDFKGGMTYTNETTLFLLNLLKPDYISGLSILGGEPMSLVNRGELANLAHTIKEAYPEKTIWIWTGYLWENLIKEPYLTENLLSNIDVLVDGPFKEEYKDISLQWRGSSNQRIIDVQKSLTNNKIELWK